MRRAQYKRQQDDSVVVRLMTDGGPCDLFAVHRDLTVEFFVSCPRVTVWELLEVLIHACGVQLAGRL